MNRSLKAAQNGLERAHKDAIDPWLNISKADFLFLTSDRSSRVAKTYRDALIALPDFGSDAVRAALKLYQQLGIRSENAEAALSAIDGATAAGQAGKPLGQTSKRILLFKGYMIDAPGRPTPRFPADMESVARRAIRKAVSQEAEMSGGVLSGIAGGASGGDILFHEICAEFVIPTRLFLGLPKDKYIAACVAPSGPGWVERFQQLHSQLPLRVLSEFAELPGWLWEKPDYSIQQRQNLWMLHNALTASSNDLTLIVLWDGDDRGGPGETMDIITQARALGARTIIIDTRKEFGL